MTMTSNRLLPVNNQTIETRHISKLGPTLIALLVLASLLSGAAALRIYAAIDHFI